MGTADFGGPVLEKLADNKENKIAVITQPDRPQGRGRKICPKKPPCSSNRKKGYLSDAKFALSSSDRLYG